MGLHSHSRKVIVWIRLYANEKMDNDQIKSKQRVMDHGEVFTSNKEVNAMLDLVKQETERIDSRFLEPACGTGNFLIEILNRKLKVVFDRYKKSQVECEKYLVLAVGSLYGIDLLMDNVIECRKKLLTEVIGRYRACYKEKASEDVEKTLVMILSRNIVCGDALTMCDQSGSPIIFSEWTNVTGAMIKRRDFAFSELLKTSGKQTSIFDAGWTNEKRKAEFVPEPVMDYPAIHYKKLIEYE